MRHVILLPLLLSACTPSVYPFYEDDQRVTDDRFLGTWQSPELDDDGQGQALIGRDAVVGYRVVEDGDDYVVTVVEHDGDEGQFHATLFLMNGNLHVDVSPAAVELAEGTAEHVAYLVVQGHHLARLTLHDEHIDLASLNAARVSSELLAHPNWLPHRRLDQHSLVMTAEPKRLQRFLRRIERRGGSAFPDWVTLDRVDALPLPVEEPVLEEAMETGVALPDEAASPVDGAESSEGPVTDDAPDPELDGPLPGD